MSPELRVFPRSHRRDCHCPRCTAPFVGAPKAPRLEQDGEGHWCFVDRPATPRDAALPLILRREAARYRRAGVRRTDVLFVACGLSAAVTLAFAIPLVRALPAILAWLGL